MAWKPDYCTAAELKTHLRITDTDDDTPLGVAITAASRAIDQACNRQFGSVSPAVARYYSFDPCQSAYMYDTFRGRLGLEIDDLMSTTNLVVKFDLDDDGIFEETVDSGDYNLFPWNAAADSRPWTRLVLATGVAFPTQLRGVEITALWGWSAVPAVVKDAALIQSARFFQRRNATFGIAGSPDLGNEMRLLAKVDPDVAVLLSSVVRHWVAA